MKLIASDIYLNYLPGGYTDRSKGKVYERKDRKGGGVNNSVGIFWIEQIQYKGNDRVDRLCN